MNKEISIINLTMQVFESFKGQTSDEENKVKLTQEVTEEISNRILNEFGYMSNVTFIPIFKMGSTTSIVDFKIVPASTKAEFYLENKND